MSAVPLDWKSELVSAGWSCQELGSAGMFQALPHLHFYGRMFPILLGKVVAASVQNATAVSLCF